MCKNVYVMGSGGSGGEAEAHDIFQTVLYVSVMVTCLINLIKSLQKATKTN